MIQFSDNARLIGRQGDEMMALCDVCKDFKDEIESTYFPIIKAMYVVREIRCNL